MRAMLPFVILIVTGAACAAEVPFVTQAMRTPSFWIDRHPSPDKIVMSSPQIAAFNQGLHAQGLTDDLARIPVPFPVDTLRSLIAAQADGVLRQDLFSADGTKADDLLKARLSDRMALGMLHEDVVPRYAFTLEFTDERLLPTDEPLYASPGDMDFDEVQNSGLDPATPVVVLHQSTDGQWLFVKDGISCGWVRAAKIAFTDQKLWRRMVARVSCVTVVAAHGDIFLDESMSQAAGTARMGARLMFKRIRRGSIEIMLPRRRDDGTAAFVSAFMRPADVVRGVLPYDARTVIAQAFKLLDAPYGWGDRQGRQDCSRFIQMIFATVGLQLPRNSAEQGRAGLSVAELGPGLAAEEKFARLAGNAIGGLTLLRLQGHIMLYLGEVDDRLYAIHAMWAYRQKEAGAEVTRVMGRVVVSDLSLGKGSSRGSLLDRVLTARFLGPDNKG